jgi:chromosome segregation ATPase
MKIRNFLLYTDTELRLRIQRQIKQKQSLEYELDKEHEKLEMIRLDIITLTSPCMTHGDMKELCDEITRLRSVCERLTDEIDVMTETRECSIK